MNDRKNPHVLVITEQSARGIRGRVGIAGERWITEIGRGRQTKEVRAGEVDIGSLGEIDREGESEIGRLGEMIMRERAR